MSSNQIYVLETLVKRIQPENGVVFEDLRTISVGFKFAQLINFDIGSEHFTPPGIDQGNQNPC